MTSDGGHATTRLSRNQRLAMEFLTQGRDHSRGHFDPHGYTINEPTFFDVEIHQAAVHWRTAEALQARGLLRIENCDPEYGCELWLT